MNVLNLVGTTNKPLILSKGLEKSFNRVGEFTSVGQRALLGATALATQPFIDYYNPNVDKDTAKYSTARTIVKILVGTSVGIMVRAGAIKIAQQLVNKGIIKGIDKALSKTAEGREALAASAGTILGLFACLGTNFLIDMPLSKWGMDFAVEKFNLKSKENQKIKG